MNKRKIYITFFLFVFCFGLKAQYNTEFINYDNIKRSVSVNLDYDAGSNGMNSKLTNKLIFGGYIDDDLKNQSAKRLKQKNNLGISLNSDVSAFVKGNSNVDFLISFKDQEILNATYTKDLYNLLFYGNNQYRGQTANLENCNANVLRFQEIKFGAIMHTADSAGKFGIALSFLKGEQLAYFNANKNSNLYTSPDGNELVLNSNFNMALSDPNKNKLSQFNGVGASADIFYETSYKSKVGKRGVLIVNANNIGFIHWLNNSNQYRSDSSVHFSGYNVKNILDLKDSTFNKISKDSLLHGLANTHKQNFNTNIPTNLVVINKIYFGQQQLFCLQTGFRYIFNANYKPYVFIEPEYRIKQVTFTLHTGYGGYVRLDVGASVMWNSKQWCVRLGSNSLQGYVIPRSASGQGLFFTLAKKFK